VLLSAEAMVADLAGDRSRAVELVRAVAGAGVHPGNAVTAAGPHLVRIAVRGGERELAAGLLAEIERRTIEESTGQQASLWYCRGIVDGDAELLLAAERRYAEDGSPIAAGRAAEDAAVLLAAAGQATAARDTYARAFEHYSRLSATTDIARAGAALRAHGLRLGAHGPRRRPKQGWDSLTAAERRVADLVARGKTNREIATDLVVSVRTVDSHVSRILGKLGYVSRNAVIRSTVGHR
jgi:DNA-binding CsgD family transcriptional regulator